MNMMHSEHLNHYGYNFLANQIE